MQIRTKTEIIRSNAGVRTARLLSILLVFVVATGTCFAGAVSSESGDYDLARLQSGEIMLQVIDSDKPGGAARVTALFHASADAIWEVIGHCEFELIYIRGLKSCEVLQPGRTNMLMRHRLRSSWYTPTLDFTFKASRKSGNSGEAHLVSGNLKVLQGRWKLIPLAQGNDVIVVHEIRIQPKIPAPRWLVRRSLRKDLPDMLACIRGLANASEDNQRITADLKRCPGDISP